jgi:hypothetical protein
MVVDGAGNVYAGGFGWFRERMNGFDFWAAGYWKNIKWNKMTNVYGTSKSTKINSLVVDGSGNIYAGGYSSSAK